MPIKKPTKLHATVKEAQCFCKSYYDDDNQLRDCTCGKCGIKQEELEQQFRGLFQESDYVDDRETLWCVDGFVYKDRFSKLLLEAKQEARKAILEEVRSQIIGEDEEVKGYTSAGTPFTTVCQMKNWEYKTRNELRTEQRQKLSLMEGNNK